MARMMLFTILATVLGLVRAVPQCLRLLRTRQAHGVSVDTAATSTIVSCGWATYGLLTNQPTIGFASGASALIFASITVLALRFGRRVNEFKIAPVWLVVLLLAVSTGGVTGLSVVLPISVLAANIPQLWVASREGNLNDLSLGTWLLALAEGMVWGGYGLVQGDLSVITSSGFQVATSGLIVAFKLAHMAKRPKPPELTLHMLGEER